MRIAITVVTLLCLANVVYGDIISTVKFVSYQATVLDSKASSKKAAIEEAKRSLLDEMGVLIVGESTVIDSQLVSDKTLAITAGIISIEILDEKWDGTTYQAKIKLVSDSEHTQKTLALLQKRLDASKELTASRRAIATMASQIRSIKLSKTVTKEQQEQYALLHEQLNDATNQFLLGIYSVAGEGNQQQYKEAFRWYLKSAQNGNSWGQLLVGMDYSEGRGTSKDLAKAFYWFQKSAEQNNSEGIFALATAYYYGRGVLTSKVKAFDEPVK